MPTPDSHATRATGALTEAALRATAADWVAGGRAAMIVTVLQHRGSVPRETGTRMLVSIDAVVGTIGGGHLERQALERARARLASTAWAGGAAQDWPVALGPTLGQCCGGALVLRLAALDADALAAWPVPAPRFVLQLFGAGHVGRAIVRLLSDIDCRVQWIDERESEFPAGPLPPHIERVCVEPVEAEVDAAPPGAFVLVLTHSHDLDLRISEAVLKRGDFGFLGLIGSATKRARFLRRLEARGVPPAALARLNCPIGVPGIAGKSPAVIAVSVVAQLLQQG